MLQSRLKQLCEFSVSFRLKLPFSSCLKLIAGGAPLKSHVFLPLKHELRLKVKFVTQSLGELILPLRRLVFVLLLEDIFVVLI